MIVSWNWLAEYVRLEMSVEELASRLALAGLNHEATEEVGGDLALDLEVTSNRPDCLSHLGIAREVAVLFGRTATEPDPQPSQTGQPVETCASVRVEAPDLCPRFTGRVISGLRIGESPWWLRKRLETLGQPPISDVVDITNYVLFECGQPLHAYDLDRLAGRTLIVRRARKGETLKAINNKTYELDPEMLVIADAERPVGLAGVMGGLDTEIGPETKNILIESAQFDPISIRRTARALGLFSPSSYRFERPMDPERTEWASRRCSELILKLAGGTLHPGLLDVGSPPPKQLEIRLRFEQIARVLGIDVPRDRAVAILQSLGLALRDGSPATLSVTFQPPSWRSDLDREIDLIEEVARIHGYEHIPEDCPVPLTDAPRGVRERIEAEIRDALTGLGFDEAVTFSLIAEELAFPLPPAPALAPIRVEHSTRKKEVLLRQSLVPSLLAARAHNEAHGTPDAELFEIAHVYLPRPGHDLPDEPTRLGLVASRDFFAMKGAVEALLGRLHVGTDLRARSVSCPPFLTGRAAELLLGDESLGFLGEVDLSRFDAVGLRGACSAAELSLDLLQTRANLAPQYRPLPPFPALARDLSLVVPQDLPWADLAHATKQVGGDYLEEVTYLDTFQGGSVPNGMQSVHFGLRFRHPARTLTGDEADHAVRDIIAACTDRFGAVLRT